MRRQEKYPDTKTFHYFNANPHNKLGDDCAVRAICTALNQSWEQTVREMTEVGIKYGYVLNDKACIEKYLASKGWKKTPQPRKADGTKYTGKEYCSRLVDKSPRIVNIGGHHMVAIVNYKVYEIWDSSDGCIGNVWTK